MSEIGQRALTWRNSLDPVVQETMQRLSYKEKLRQERAAEEAALTEQLAAAYNQAESDGQKIHILSSVIALD